jgi:uncharacterized membrane protein
MFLILPVIGILVALVVGDSANRGFDVVVGAIVGYLFADLGIIREELKGLRKTLEQLTIDMRRRTAAPNTAADSPEAAVSPKTPEEIDEPKVPADSIAIDRANMPWREFESSPRLTSPSPQGAPTPRWAPNSETSLLMSRPTTSPNTLTTPPTPESPIVAAIRGFFTGGNTLVRVGVIVLFFGVAFLLRYMAEHTHVSIEARLTGISLAAIALIVVGWRLRARRTAYALSLQGGGVGILYLIVFAALRLYKILPAEIAFPLLVAIAVLSAFLAIAQDSLWFALLAVTGGFLAPILASTGEGSHVVLFSYYLVLNVGILAAAWFKAWRPLNVAGFAFTFAIGTAWGVLKYRPEDFATTEPFLILFFLFYLAISILFTLRQPVKLTGYIDSTLIFGTPIIAFSLQSAMLHDRLMPLAYSAVALSALYLVIASVLKQRRSDKALLIESFIALGVAFLTLAVPLALDARWNAATWALEGTALIWIGCRQNRVLPRALGTLLNLVAACIVLQQFDHSDVVLSYGAYFGIVVQSAAALFSARTLHAYRLKLADLERYTADFLYLLGVGLWFAGTFSEIVLHLAPIEVAATLVLVSLTTVMSTEIFKRSTLHSARFIALLQLPVMWLFAAFAASKDTHPFAQGGWWAWSLAFAALYSVMYRLEGPSRTALANILNATATWLVCALLSWEIAWQVNAGLTPSDTWRSAVWAIVPAALLWWLPRLVTRVQWPFAKNREAYLFISGVGITAYLAAWSLITNLTSAGDTAPLPYLPVLNALDIAQAAVLIVLLRYWRFLKSVNSPGFARMDKRLPPATLAALTFVFLNAILLRSLHQWFGVGLRLDQLMASTLVQTTVSLFWTVLALLTMLFATRKANRMIWVLGATLLGVVIAKLFLVDLSRSGSVERIVSFVGVGLLMLIVGYLSPLPPAREARL